MKLDAAIAKHDEAEAARRPIRTDDQRAGALETFRAAVRRDGIELHRDRVERLCAPWSDKREALLAWLTEPLPHLGGDRTPLEKKTLYDRPDDSAGHPASVPSVRAPTGSQLQVDRLAPHPNAPPRWALQPPADVLTDRLLLRDAPMPTRPGYSSSASQWWQRREPGDGGWMGS